MIADLIKFKKTILSIFFISTLVLKAQLKQYHFNFKGFATTPHDNVADEKDNHILQTASGISRNYYPQRLKELPNNQLECLFYIDNVHKKIACCN